MKELGALLLLGIVIAIGWHQPFKAHFQSIAGSPVEASPAPAAVPPTPAAAAGRVASVAPIAPAETPAPRDASWMWKKTEMDAPRPVGGAKRGR